GFDPASFVQRFGRAARGDVDGRVIVRVDGASLARKNWLNIVLYKLRALGKAAISVDDFFGVVLATYQLAFVPRGDFGTEKIPSTFGSMPQRAPWCAGLFWVALEHAEHLRKGQERTLENFKPEQARVVGYKLGVIRGAGTHAACVWA